MACPEAWRRNPGLVLDFYNERHRAVREAAPNAAHLALVELERAYDVRIVTQRVDDLHERVGSSRVLHLHGEIRKARSPRRWPPRASPNRFSLKSREIRWRDEPGTGTPPVREPGLFLLHRYASLGCPTAQSATPADS